MPSLKTNLLLTFDMVSKLKERIARSAIKVAMERTGHGRQLGFSIINVDRGSVSLEYPYDKRAVGNPLNGVVHGGIVVSLLDTCCGCAAMSAMSTPSVTPTMDLRLDYMHPAEPEWPIFASGRVYRTTSSVIFCRGSAWQEDAENPIAHCVATFVRIDMPGTEFSSVFKGGIKRFLPWSST